MTTWSYGPDAWRVRVTDADIKRATDEWLSALDGGAPEERVDDLRQELHRLCRAEAHQVTIDA